MGDGSDDSPFKESGSEPTSMLAVEFQNVAKKLVEREQEMKQKYIDLKKKYEDDQSLLHSHTLKLKQKEIEIDELKKVNLECMKRIKVYKKRFLVLDERVFILEETAKDLKSGNLENDNKQQKDFAAPDESSSGLPLSNKKRDSDKRTKPRLSEIIEIDDDDDGDTDDVPISILKRKRDSNEVKKEHNSDDNDLDYKSTLTTNKALKEIKRECNSDYVDKIPTETQSSRNLGELHSQQLTSQALYSPHSEFKPNKLASSFNTSRSSSGQDNDKVDDTYKYVLAKLKKEKEIWESEADMLKEFEKNDELSMNAICALYRQRTNVHDQSDISRINQLARLLFDGDSQKNLRKTASELNRLDLHHIRMLAKKYSARIFDIYQKKIDPFFRPRS